MSISIDKQMLLDTKIEYNKLADETDDLFVALAIANYNNVNREDYDNIMQIYNTKRRQCDELHDKLTMLEQSYYNEHKHEDRHVEFINTTFNHNELISKIWEQKQIQIQSFEYDEETAEREYDEYSSDDDITDNKEDNKPKLTQNDFDTEWEYKMYLSLCDTDK